MPQQVMFKFLTCLLFAAVSAHGRSEIVNQTSTAIQQEKYKTHLRWSISAGKDAVQVEKRGTELFIRSLDNSLFMSLAEGLAKIGIDNNYFESFDYKEGGNGLPSEARVRLKDESVELFTFYQDKKNVRILDFWINQDLVNTKHSALKKPEATAPVAAKATGEEAPVKVASAPAKAKTAKKTETKKEVATKKEERRQGPYRDFRYGSAFIWNYKPFIPPLESEVNLASKGPDYFYQVKDRAFSGDDKKETHMQLSINFYRQQKWGLMTKSIDLYEKTYGQDSNKELNDFMKAVSMFKSAIKSGTTEQSEAAVSSKGVFAAAIGILENVVDRTEDYELKQAALRYMLEASLRDKDYIQSLQLAKKLYVEATGQFDDEMIARSSRVILHSLANLRQVEKLEEFLGNKAVMRVLPAQEGDAYIGFLNLANGEEDQVLARFTANEKSYARPVHPAILFNTGEAYFRKAQYGKAATLFDEFAANYGFYDVAGFARLRIALSYDLIGADEKKTLALYKSAINKSSDPLARFEAKTRYVGLRVARKRSPDESDLETIAFLEATPVERKSFDQDTRKLLWLTRLRTLIVSQDYEGALAYLSSIPLNSLRQVEQRAFHGDGAEIVLGVVKEAYLKEDYARALKVWEAFKDKYENRVAKNPYMGFIVADSRLKLGLDQSFEQALKELEQFNKASSRVFPRWVTPHKNIELADYVKELRLAKLFRDENWEGANEFLKGLKNDPNINYNYYKGLVSFHMKKYNEATKLFEELLVKPNAENMLSPRQSLSMLSSYAESLYQGSDQDRFRTNTAALLNDLRRSGAKTDMVKRAIERLEYLYLESLNGEKKVNYDLLARKSEEFLAEKDNSVYGDRVKYLRAVALIQVSNQDEGKRLLEELINGSETPEYIKGLARSELASLALKNKTL